MAELYPLLAQVAFPLVGSGFLSITELSTEIFFAAIAVALVVFKVVIWNKIGKHNFRNIFSRVTLIVLINVFTIAAVGIGLNRMGDFYANWSDLFGLHSNLNQEAISPQNLALLNKFDVKRAEKSKNGSLIFRKVIRGENSGISSNVIVVFSPSIAKHLKSSKNFNIGTNYQVVELFPGYPGVPSTWIGAMKGLDALEKMDHEKKIPPTILIIPAINVVPGLDTECLNIPGEVDVETWLTSDMKSFAAKFIGVDNRKWATFGYSTGGWCAAELSIRHQDQFDRAVSLAGYFSPAFSAGITSDERKQLIQQYDLINTLKASTNQIKLLAIYSAQNDFETKSLIRFQAKIGDLIPLKTIEIPEGGHNIQVWRPYVYTGFEWISNANS